MNDKKERKYQRLECSLTGKMIIAGKSRSIEVADINEKGARIICTMNLSLNEETEIEINTTQDISFKTNCKIVWSTIYLSGYMLGIIFINNNMEEIGNILVQSNLAKKDYIKSQVSEHKETYNMIFENYSEEVFLRRVEEFVDYIKEKDPEKGPWAKELHQKLKDTINEILNEFNKWSE